MGDKFGENGIELVEMLRYNCPFMGLSPLPQIFR